jgi:WD40 repeat protein
MVCTRDGRRAYVGSSDGTIRLWDLEEGKEIAQFRDSTQCTNDIKLSADEVSGGNDAVVRVWDANTAELICRCKGHTNFVTEVEFAPGGKWLASTSHDGTIRVWNAETGEELRKFFHERHPFVLREELEDGRVRNQFRYYACGSLVITSDGTQIAAGGNGTRVSLWDVYQAKEAGSFRGHTPKPLELPNAPHEGWKKWAQTLMENGIRRTPSAEHLISAGVDGTVRVWSRHTFQEVGRINIPFVTRRFEVSEDGRRAIFGDENGVLHVWALPVVSK